MPAHQTVLDEEDSDEGDSGSSTSGKLHSQPSVSVKHSVFGYFEEIPTVPNSHKAPRRSEDMTWVRTKVVSALTPILRCLNVGLCHKPFRYKHGLQ